jgi:hypothetical protein
VIGFFFSSITSVTTATFLKAGVKTLGFFYYRVNEGPMDGQLFARAVPSKFAFEEEKRIGRQLDFLCL